MTADASEKDNDFLFWLVAGFIIGVLVTLIIPALLHISPLYVDCGCGASAQAARNCVASGDFNSSWCGWLK